MESHLLNSDESFNKFNSIRLKTIGKNEATKNLNSSSDNKNETKEKHENLENEAIKSNKVKNNVKNLIDMIEMNNRKTYASMSSSIKQPNLSIANSCTSSTTSIASGNNQKSESNEKLTEVTNESILSDKENLKQEQQPDSNDQQIISTETITTSVSAAKMSKSNSNSSSKSLCSSGSTSTTSMNSTNSNRNSIDVCVEDDAVDLDAGSTGSGLSSSSFNNVYNISSNEQVKEDRELLNKQSKNDENHNQKDWNLIEKSDSQVKIEADSAITSQNKINSLETTTETPTVNTDDNNNQNDFNSLAQHNQIMLLNENEDENYDEFDENLIVNMPKLTNTNTLKRTQLINLIFDLYDLNFQNLLRSTSTDLVQNIESTSTNNRNEHQTVILVEGYMEKLPPGKNLKNSLLLAWRKRYFKLNSIGNLYEYDINDKTNLPKSEPCEVFNLMGGKIEFEQNKVISLDDSRGNCLVIRCCTGYPNTITNNNKKNSDSNNKDSSSDEYFIKWKNALDSQIIDRSDSLWVRPDYPLIPLNDSSISGKKLNICLNKKVLIVDIGTCSIRAGLFNNEPKLPKLFVPTVCAKDSNNNKYKVGFDAFDFLMSSSAPSTIDLHKSISTWSLTAHSNPLIFPLRAKGAIDKLNFDIDSIEAILEYVVDTLNITCPDYQILIVTTHKLTDKINVQFLNMLLSCEKFRFESATIINQTLLTLYAYNSNVGVVANLGEKIDIVPICNGVSFQSGVTNLAYGGTTMSEFLNSFISRSHVNYVNDMEQYYIRFIKEKSCYAALNYQEELKKYPSDSIKYTIDLAGHANELKKVEFPESARFKCVEGLFNPEIWGIDGQGIHKLIFKAIQSTSMDLRREMARSIFLCGGMSQIPGVKERLEKELRQLFPPSLKIKVNCSDHSYHCAYLGAFRFIEQPEYEKLQITRDEWLKENVNCLRKWRMM